jgi:hypothetical protein
MAETEKSGFFDNPKVKAALEASAYGIGGGALASGVNYLMGNRSLKSYIISILLGTTGGLGTYAALGTKYDYSTGPTDLNDIQKDLQKNSSATDTYRGVSKIAMGTRPPKDMTFYKDGETDIAGTVEGWQDKKKAQEYIAKMLELDKQIDENTVPGHKDLLLSLPLGGFMIDAWDPFKIRSFNVNKTSTTNKGKNVTTTIEPAGKNNLSLGEALTNFKNGVKSSWNDWSNFKPGSLREFLNLDPAAATKTAKFWNGVKKGVRYAGKSGKAGAKLLATLPFTAVGLGAQWLYDSDREKAMQKLVDKREETARKIKGLPSFKEKK